MKKILLIDDDINLCKVTAFQLKEAGYEVFTSHSGKEGLENFKQQSKDVVITDLILGDIDGIDVLEKLKKMDPDVSVIIITAYGTIENAIRACKKGADDYVTKPFSIDQLTFSIEKTLNFKKLAEENVYLQKQLFEKYRFDNIVGSSTRMQEVYELISKVSGSDATILIQGESGTGKELIARAIHYNSPRHKAKLIVVNCASIPDNLLESELFGYEKGAFTGAMKQRIGKFEQANNGTIFLDEVGDLNIDLQAKILRVLQDKQIERIGGKRAIQLDLRFIAATNQDLEEKVKRKEFREDLYYRLNVITIKLPPLRERKEDIPLLVEHFLSKYKKGKSFKIDPQVINIFADYNWPGNIRELENVIERATVLADGDTITLEDLPPPLLEISSLKKAPKTPLYHMEDLSLEEIERRAIISALERSRGNKSKAAKMLKIPRHVLLYRLKKYKIDWPN